MFGSLVCWFKGEHKENAIYSEKDIFCDPNGKYLHTTYTLNKVCKVCDKKLGHESGTKRKNL